MRRLMIAGALVALGTSAEIVWAVPRADEYGTGDIVVTDGRPASPGESSQGASDAVWYSYRSVEVGPDGLCWRRHSTTDKALASAYNSVYSEEAVAGDGLAQLPQCPTDGTTVAPPSPAELARDFWDVRRLPSPTLAVTPDYAITGKPVYLRIGNPRTTTFDVDNPLGPAVHINATSRYRIDWGDGTAPTTTTSQGGPWPHGDVTHVYDHAVPQGVTITVIQLWSATWTAGPGTGGSLDNLQTAGTLTLRVEQLQAVRNR